jgi:hypothetical protein
MLPVQSSNIEAIGFNDESGTLYVQFHGGSTYSYANVPAEVVQGLIGAASKGSYFAQKIKNKYVTSKE